MLTLSDNLPRRHYRADIDGLRAISIIAVLAFHAFPEAVNGGFVGVDVFFVISGFLIGGLIFAEISTGRFDFVNFYARRSRRIFPALILVLIVTFATGWYVLFPDEYRQLGKHVLGAMAFVSNFVLLDETSYFDSAAHTKPLLHLWSLAIEEQFYVLWPIYVWAAIRREKYFALLTAVLSIASFVLSVSLASRSAAFYLPVCRFWEIMSGSLLAYGARKSWPKFERHKNFGGIVGFASIIAALFVTPERNFPGWWALLPVVGTLLLIWAGPKSWLNRRVLSSPPLVFIGAISYPLYLWHWPLLVYGWIVHGGPPTTAAKIILLSLSVILSCGTYWYVERPVRFGPHRFAKTIICIASLLSIGSIGAWTMASGGFVERAVAQYNARLAKDLRIPVETYSSDGSCSRNIGIDLHGKAVCMVNTASPTVLITGDSQAIATYSAIFARIVHLPTVLLATTSGDYVRPACLQDVAFDEWLNGHEACQEVMSAVVRVIASVPSIRTVLIVFQRDNPFHLDRPKMAQLQRIFLAAGKEVVYVLGAPSFTIPASACRLRKIEVLGLEFTLGNSDSVCREPRDEFEKIEIAQREYIARLRQNDPRVFIYDPLDAFCDDRFCYQTSSEGSLFWTVQHVNEKGSARLLKNFEGWARQNLRLPLPLQ